MPELKDNSVEIKVQASFKGLLSSGRSWATYDNPEEAGRMLKVMAEEHQEKMEELEAFDKERWKELIERYVVEKGWGQKRTLQKFAKYFEFSSEEKEFLKTWIEIYRKVRLEEMDLEDAERTVKHEMDPRQKRFGEL